MLQIYLNKCFFNFCGWVQFYKAIIFLYPDMFILNYINYLKTLKFEIYVPKR